LMTVIKVIGDLCEETKDPLVDCADSIQLIKECLELLIDQLLRGCTSLHCSGDAVGPD
jgi:hypothetical protein